MKELFVFMTFDRTSVIKVPDSSLDLFPPLAFTVELVTPKGFNVIVQVFEGDNSRATNSGVPVPLVEFMNVPLVRCQKPVDLDVNLAKFVVGYTECMLWSSNDDDGNDLRGYELAPETEKKINEQCRAFVESNWSDLQLYAEQYTPKEGYNVWECAGRDFWLTRCGHGAGFWDRGLGDLGQRLTAASRSAGGVDAYLGDDKEVYLS